MTVWARRIGFILALAFLFLTFVNASWLADSPRGYVKLVAHRGLMQLPRADANGDCRARAIEPPIHDFIENTLPALAQERRFVPEVGDWRSFELSTTVNVADVKGTVKLWLPVPDVETEWQQPLDNTWTGNASVTKLVADPKSGTRMFYAEFPETVAAPIMYSSTRSQPMIQATNSPKVA